MPRSSCDRDRQHRCVVERATDDLNAVSAGHPPAHPDGDYEAISRRRSRLTSRLRIRDKSCWGMTNS
jgi:hypothetical protein